MFNTTRGVAFSFLLVRKGKTGLFGYSVSNASVREWSVWRSWSRTHTRTVTTLVPPDFSPELIWDLS